MIFQFTLLSLIFTDTNDNEDIKIQKEIGARNWIWKNMYERNYVERKH